MRLGLLSTARINDSIIAAAAASEQVEVVAVASRDAARAADYAAARGIARSHGSYDALLADDQVDAVYVSLPNRMHVPWTRRALEAGRHVLCEKPMSMRAGEVEGLFDLADERGLVLTEGFMWRHHPQADRLTGLVADGAIGTLRHVRASFSFVLDRAGDVRLDPELDGGSLADIGCYCVSGARLLAGEPVSVRAQRVATEQGVDARVVATLRFPGDVLASIDCGFDVAPRTVLEAAGDAGTITLTDPWHGRDPRIVLTPAGGDPQEVAVAPADPYVHQLEDLAGAIAGRRTPRLGREDAVGQARALAALLAAMDDDERGLP
jgi:xylose dehydrogenase (NAD/NADP)